MTLNVPLGENFEYSYSPGPGASKDNPGVDILLNRELLDLKIEIGALELFGLCSYWPGPGKSGIFFLAINLLEVYFTQIIKKK